MLGNNIKKYRNMKGLSQEQLAEALDVTRQSVSKWETGLAQPDADNLIKLASELGTTVEALSAEVQADNELNNEKIASMLHYGETIIWSGQPNIDKKFTKYDAFFVPFSVLWFGFSVFWEIIATIGSVGLFSIFGIPFCVIGFYICIGRFIYKKKNKQHTYYYITDRRIIIYNDYKRIQVNDMPLSRAAHISYNEDADGIGSINFEEKNNSNFGFYYSMYANTGLDRFFNSSLPNSFFDIDNVREVYHILRSIQEGPRSIHESPVK